MFDIEVFDIKFNTDFIGRNFVYVEEVDSTNSLLLDKANKFNQNGTVVLAEKQTHGRGRLDRQWHSAKGLNLTFSILITDKKLLKKNIHAFNFLSALSVGISIENLYQIKTQMKWPNDVLLNDKKVAGILLESSSLGDKIERLIIGIGVNVNQAVFQGTFRKPPTSLKIEVQQTIERERLLAEILNVFEEELLKFKKEPKEILKEWKSRCYLIGEKISVDDGQKIKYGIFDDVDENGFILLKSRGDKMEKILFGDVSLA